MLLDCCRIYPPPSGHSEVKHERIAPVGFNQPIFRPPPEARHDRTGQSLAKVHGKSSPQIRSTNFHTRNPLALQNLG